MRLTGEDSDTGNGPGLRHRMLNRMRSGLKEQLSTQSMVVRYNKLKQQRNEVRTNSNSFQREQTQVCHFPSHHHEIQWT